MTSEQAYWNGMPTEAERGTAVVADSPAFPRYWARRLIGQRISVVRVVLDGVNHGGGGTSYLDDRDGQGWLKVTVGRGGPGYGHADVEIAPGSFAPAALSPAASSADGGESELSESQAGIPLTNTEWGPRCPVCLLFVAQPAREWAVCPRCDRRPVSEIAVLRLQSEGFDEDDAESAVALLAPLLRALDPKAAS